jgi:DNA-binding response OmpR family regulator
MRILVIEDEPRILGFLTVGLEAEGFAVDGAEDGISGLALAVREPYELVVLDLQLPRLDGLRLLDELHRSRPELPVLILSARTDLPTKLRSFQLGANDYLSKPFSFDELVARVRVHVRGARRASRTALPISRTASSGCFTTSSRTPARS